MSSQRGQQTPTTRDYECSLHGTVIGSDAYAGLLECLTAIGSAQQRKPYRCEEIDYVIESTVLVFQAF